MVHIQPGLKIPCRVTQRQTGEWTCTAAVLFSKLTSADATPSFSRRSRSALEAHPPHFMPSKMLNTISSDGSAGVGSTSALKPLLLSTAASCVPVGPPSATYGDVGQGRPARWATCRGMRLQRKKGRTHEGCSSGNR